jgi:hypothetical protein
MSIYKFHHDTNIIEQYFPTKQNIGKLYTGTENFVIINNNLHINQDLSKFIYDTLLEKDKAVTIQELVTNEFMGTGLKTLFTVINEIDTRILCIVDIADNDTMHEFKNSLLSTIIEEYSVSFEDLANLLIKHKQVLCYLKNDNYDNVTSVNYSESNSTDNANQSEETQISSTTFPTLSEIRLEFENVDNHSKEYRKKDIDSMNNHITRLLQYLKQFVKPLYIVSISYNSDNTELKNPIEIKFEGMFNINLSIPDNEVVNEICERLKFYIEFYWKDIESHYFKNRGDDIFIEFRAGVNF